MLRLSFALAGLVVVASLPCAAAEPEVLSYVHEAGTWGLSLGGVELDFARVVKRSRDVSDRLTKGVAALLRKYKCDLVTGRGRIARAPAG